MKGLETLIWDIFASIEWAMCFRDPCHCCGCLRSWPRWAQQHLATAEPPERFLCHHIWWLPPDPPRADRSHLFWPSAIRGGELLHNPSNISQLAWPWSWTRAIFFLEQSHPDLIYCPTLEIMNKIFEIKGAESCKPESGFESFVP